MTSIERFEEEYINAYCRLSYDIWYQGYKDGISKYLHEDTLGGALIKTIKDNVESKVIQIDGTIWKEKHSLKECIEVILQFLYGHEKYSVVFAIPYEEQKEADTLAYEQTNYRIDSVKFLEKMYDQDYVMMIWSVGRESERYLKIYENATIDFAIHNGKNKNFMEGNMRIEQELYVKLVQWAKNYIDTHKIEFMEGMSNERMERFQVNFDFDKLGISNVDNWHVPTYSFEKIHGNGVLTKLLKLSGLEKFVQEEME